jgi:hypothetical protein
MGRINRCALLLFLAVIIPQAAVSGVNSSGRAWLSWDRAGLISKLYMTTFDQQEVYVQIEGAPDVQALVVQLKLVATGDTAVLFVTSSPDSGSGWAEHLAAPRSFLGDSTYEWDIHFPVGIPRSKIKYTLAAIAPTDTLRGTVEAPDVIVQDSYGNLDTLGVMNTAIMMGESLPEAEVPTDSLPGMVIVELEPGVTEPGYQHIFPTDIRSAPLSQQLAQLDFTIGERVFPNDTPADTLSVSVEGDTVHCRDLSRIYVFKTSDTMPVAWQDSLLSQLAGVENVNYVGALAGSSLTQDPLVDDQWHLNRAVPGNAHADSAWALTTGLSSILVGVVDTGIDKGHPDLQNDPSHPLVIYGHDYGESDSDVTDDAPMQDRGHGTSTAGIIGARTNNNIGIAGLMWNGRLLIQKSYEKYRFFLGIGYHPSYAVAGAIRDAVRWGARVINLSVGYPISVARVEDYLPPFGAAYRSFWKGEPLAVATYTAWRLGVNVVASAGNQSHNWAQKPAYFPWVTCVGASDATGSRSSFSNYGSNLDCLAPGGAGIVTTTSQDLSGPYISGGYDHDFSGTSAAAPMVTGANALVCAFSDAHHLQLSNEDARRLIQFACRHQAAAPATWDEFTGYGLLNINNALRHLTWPYTVMRKSVSGAESTTVTKVESNIKRNFYGGPLPSDQYYVDRYEVRRHITFCGQLSETPWVWGRTRSSTGWSADNVNSEVPYTGIENATATGFDIVSDVFWVNVDANGSAAHRGWWPCQPSQVQMAYTAITRTPLQIAEIAGLPTAACQQSFSAVTCGGEDSLTYQWFKRTGGGQWSGVLGTGPAIDISSSSSATIDVRLVVTSGAVVREDTMTVAYGNCVVGVAQPSAVNKLRLRIEPNPLAGMSLCRIELPNRGRIALEIFDLQGRRVSTLVDGEVDAGEHQFPIGSFAGNAVRAGVYLARLRTPDGERRLRFVVLQ